MSDIVCNAFPTLKSTSGIDTFGSTRTEVPCSAVSTVAVISLLLLQSRLHKMYYIVVHTESPIPNVLYYYYYYHHHRRRHIFSARCSELCFSDTFKLRMLSSQ